MYKKISEYGIIGNLHSVALVGLDGSIDWLCLPHIDSPSVFGSLLDDKKGGRFALVPLNPWDSISEYIAGTNILRTKFRTRKGIVHLTDFMPIPLSGREEREEEEHELYRLVEGIKGDVRVKMVFDPQFNYARSKTSLERFDTYLIARGKNENMVLCCTHSLTHSSERETTEWTLSEGESLWLHLRYGTELYNKLDPQRAQKSLEDTTEYWRNWLKKSETGTVLNLGSYKQMVERSALTLKLLYYEPSGAIAAAATTSLPEEVGGIRNWDYRFSWVRDTSFTLQALFNLGHLSETEGYLRWIEQLISKHGVEKLRIMYRLNGEEVFPEQELLHLDGYKGSRPVRIGNEAATQNQIDIYGEIMDAALRLSDYVGKISPDLWPFLRAICDWVIVHWHDKDNGIWEMRGEPFHFVYSKVMCWVALDRGITIAERYGFQADRATWKVCRSQIKEEVLEKGWSEKKHSFVQHYDTEALDASSLLIPLFGFLPFEDPRIISTIQAIDRELSHNGFLYRYRAEDGLSGGEGTFLLCTFWRIRCLIGLQELEKAKDLLHQIEGIANHLGLFAEEYDMNWQEALGNFPQAFTHIGYIDSVIALCNEMTKEREEKSIHDKKRASKALFLARKIILNEGEPLCDDMHAKKISIMLKNSMNVLRGAFFDSQTKRIAYEKMRYSDAYKRYEKVSYCLKKMRLDELKTRDEQVAFWINMYNVIVIHGVVTLRIRDSVKEVRNFFKRIHFQIEDMLFSADDIEHGILRGNRRPPYSLFKVFKGNDSRLTYSITPLDWRIHFTLVCASSSCPPIEVYTAENLDRELAIATETFLNAGGVKINQEQNRVFLSRIFKWYSGDFNTNQEELLRSIAPYIYNEEDRMFLERKAGYVTIDYQDYDWRLNRY
ncbi:MAG: DUF547 domain-containing protein [Deltaproteobacteria bacterium]|nr:DUF547 domain-containing protein [Deltaproteobacteria bacterium]MBW1938781.1 DUF547 domain-containing protein [Deltaproteobacteria bacterium]MBW1964247.1 DUF547 domain-containing protein [Deltaproteobacteria bacterium]MBW2350607.1 DUF547 domain-containing protein [Deltaproteobacteria bacterium]